jgi:transcriptional regulator with XRE-family HTH domain
MSEPASPFADLIQREFMYKQVPPLTSALDLARALHIAPQTAVNWLKLGRLPDPQRLPEIAQITGIPLTRLLRACNIPLPTSISDTKEFADYLAKHFANNQQAYTAQQVIDMINHLQQEYEKQAS